MGSTLADPTHAAHAAHAASLDALRRALGGVYEIEGLLGAGGMGAVYLAHDVMLDRPVAIKVIAPGMATTPALRERFLREARTVARLRHPSVVAMYAAGEADGVLYFVMEYVPGESLRARLARDGTWDDEGAVAALRDLARALAYAHAEGVVHRDVKPENVLIDRRTGRALLADFGVAALMDPCVDDGDRPGNTRAGFVLGSPQYMSPEQASGDPSLDGRSDVYSLGLVAYEMFAGAPAIAPRAGTSIVARQITELPPPLATRGERVPRAVATAVDRALAKDPDDRWPTAAAMADALVQEPRPRATRRRAVAVLLVAGIAAVAAAARASLGTHTAGPDPRASYLVAPFEVLSPDAELSWLHQGSVSMLTLDLAQWRDLEVVDYEHALDLQRDLGIAHGRPVGLDDAVRMARRAHVGTVVVGELTASRDSLAVDARVYDVATGRRLDAAHESAPRAGDPRLLFDRLARDLLDLAGAPPVSLALAHATTSSVEAYRDYLEGLRALNAWQLVRADSLFDAATRADSTFALANYKRALASGWRDKDQSATREMLHRAQRFAARLPVRERGLLDAFAQLTLAFDADASDDTARAALFAAAQQRYRAVVARDSGDAEAWYGLGDAYYHDFGGALDSATVARWSRARAAFHRTLALDSSFHLAYSHLTDIYQSASRPGSSVVLDGETLRFLPDDASRRAFGAARLAAAQRRAQALAVGMARAWAATDPVPQAHVALAFAYATAGHVDSAAAVLARGQSLAGASVTELPFIRAQLLAHVDPATARAVLDTALRATGADALRTEGGPDRFPFVLQAASGAAMRGDLHAVDAVARLAAAAQRTPYNSPLSTAQTARWWAAFAALAAGAPPASVLPTIDAGIAAIDRQRPRVAAQLGAQGGLVPYVAYLATRDARYRAQLRRWSGEGTTSYWTELDALGAIEKGDTLRARAIARTFPSPDSARASGARIMPARWVARAEVLTALGDARGALAAYALLDPTRIVDAGYVDPGLTFWARSLLARGRLHEQLGERAEAAAAYERFLALWKDADPTLQPQVREARAGLIRVRDVAAR